MAENGFDQEIENYQESFASLDAAATILEVILKADLDGKVQEEGLEDPPQDGEVPPIAPLKSRSGRRE